MTADPFLAHVARLCASERTRAKWLFVPNHALGLTLGTRLAREGCAWSNLRFVTPLDIAIRMAAPFLLERGVDPSEEQLGPALMMRLLLDLPEEGGYFQPMARHESMADALWRTVRELRYAGVRAAGLAAKQFGRSKAKRREMVALLAAYENHLEVNHIADMPMVLQEAATHHDWCPIAADDLVIELPDVSWSPLVSQFLDSVPGRRAPARTSSLPGVKIPRRVASTRANQAETVERVEMEATTGASRLRFLQAVERSAPAIGDGTLDIFHAGGREAEIDEVFRRILAAGIPLDEVEIACASPAYPVLAWEKATRLEWPVTVAPGVPATATRPGRLLLRYCEWVESDFGAAALRALLQAGDCRAIGQASIGTREAETLLAAGGRLEAGGQVGGGDTGPEGARTQDGEAAGDATGVSPGQAARLLLKAEPTSGRGTYAVTLNRLAREYGDRANDPEASADERAWNGDNETRVRVLLAWIEAAMAAIPKPTGDQVDLGAMVQAARTFLLTTSGRASAIDRLALAALVAALDELRALGRYTCDLRAALRFLRERAVSLVVRRDRPRPGHLHVSTLPEAGYDGRPLVFIVGLQEGGVFPAIVEDAILLDDERKAIDPLLRTSTERQDEAVFTALSRIAAIGTSARHVCLSFSCRDTREFRETFPSWIVLQAFRLEQGDGTLTYDDLKEWLGEPASPVPPAPAQAVSDAGWWLAQARGRTASKRVRTVPVVAVREAILRTYPSLGRGIHAAAERASDAFTEFDGLVTIAGAALDPSRTGRAVSATTLENAAKCPLRFFMERGLGVRVIEEGRADDDRWLDGATKGTTLHDLFATVMRRIAKEGRTPDLKLDRPRLRALGRARLQELREQMPPPSEEVFARESREFLEDLDAFIEAECEGRHGKDPVGFEVSFGLPTGTEDEDPLGRAEPITIGLGGQRQVLLHGRIDRINRLKPGEYEVIDYKTGTYWPDNWAGDFAGGTRLQHALYGAAAEVLLKPHDANARVVQGRYVFPSVKGHGHRKRIPAPSRAKLVRVLRDVSDVIAAGAFLPADVEESCKWCEFRAACRVTDVRRAEAKRDNPANLVLEPYRRLRRDHE